MELQLVQFIKKTLEVPYVQVLWDGSKTASLRARNRICLEKEFDEALSNFISSK